MSRNHYTQRPLTALMLTSKRTLPFLISAKTLRNPSISQRQCAPEHWHVLTQFQPHLPTNNTLKTALPAVSSFNPDLLPDWESQEVCEQCNCHQSKKLTTT
jgi:hypothetical protein